MRKSDFWGIFKAWCSFAYVITIYTCVLKLDTFFLGGDMIAQKFLSIVAHTNLMKVPQLLWASLFCDITNLSLWIRSIDHIVNSVNAGGR